MKPILLVYNVMAKYTQKNNGNKIYYPLLVLITINYEVWWTKLEHLFSGQIGLLQQ